MKSKKIDLESLKDIEVIQALTNFLIILNIQSAEELYEDVDYIADQEFCGECETHKNYCECEKDREPTYMREYDDGADYED